MFEFEGIAFGPTEVTVEAETLAGALDEMGTLYNLHKDALFLRAHVRHFHDADPEIAVRAHEDDSGYKYRGFECLQTGCNLTFKENEDGIYPGRYCAYRNGGDNPKLYDPEHDHDELLSGVSPNTPFIRRFDVDVGGGGGSPPRAGQRPNRQKPRGEPQENGKAPSGPPPREAAESLVTSAQETCADGALAGECAIAGDPVSTKLRGLLSYAGRDQSYQKRVLDALGVGGFDEVAIGQLGDVVELILSEETLRENEQFEADGELPF
jgi:hypothetical protein